jgi:CRP-like cAMP-binding protein
MLDVIGSTGLHLECDLETSLIFAAVLAGNAAQIEEDPLLARRYAATPVPDDLRRPLRIQRIAESLNMPRETTRSKVAAMIQRDLLEETGAGVIVPATTFGSARMASLSVAHLAALSHCIERLAPAGCVGLARDERLATPPFPGLWGAMRAITRHVLRGIADLHAFTSPGSLLQAYLMLAILDRSAAHFSDADPILYAAYDDPPPLSAHTLVTAQGLARTLGLPRETVRRNLQVLVQGGQLTQVPGGFAIAEAVRAVGTAR